MRSFGLIGFPLSHSFSRSYFENKFAMEGISDAEFLNFSLENINDLPKLILENTDLVGFSVTIPHKEKILPFLDVSSDEATTIGAVNAVKVLRSGNEIKLYGYNTDVFGFSESLRSMKTIVDGKALVLGTGGASKAVGYVLRGMKLDVIFVSRFPKAVNEVSYDMLDEGFVKSCQIIVNTTPLGMYPNINQAPDLPYNAITPNHILFDLTYNPSETLFLKHGRKNGAMTMNGQKMLEWQAEKAWEIWNG